MNDRTVIRPGGRRPRKPTTDQGQGGQQPFGQNPQQGPGSQQPYGQNPQQGAGGQQPYRQNPQQGPGGQPPYGQNPQQGPGGQQSYGQNPQPNPQTYGQPSGYQQAQSGMQGALTDSGCVVDMVTPLFAMVANLQSAGQHPDLEQFKTHAIAQIEYFQSQNFGLGPDQQLTEYASYGVCCLIDELILNTPWGDSSSWSTESLLVLFHREAWGGERFFGHLDDMKNRPGQTLPVLALYYVSLELGFEGQYRQFPNGLRQLHDIKDDLFNIIRRQQPPSNFELSPAWQGVTDTRSGIVKYVPFWVILLVTFGIGLATFIGFGFVIGQRSDPVYRQLSHFYNLTPIKVAPNNIGSLTQTQTVTPIEAPDLNKQVVDYYLLISEILALEIEQNLVLLEDEDDSTMVKLVGAELFQSGSASLSKDFVVIIQKIGQFLGESGTGASVTGHTDNVPMSSLAYSSNWALSQARADTVKNILVSSSESKSKVKAQGMGDEQNLVDNKTAQNRAKNRRVEIVIIK
jgi:type VI secretion system protein ImpK